MNKDFFYINKCILRKKLIHLLQLKYYLQYIWRKMPRVIISQDYDGCYSIVAPGGVEHERTGKNLVHYSNPSNRDLTRRMEDTPRQYMEYLASISAGADAVSVYVGSDRQSYGLDQLNARKNKNGSVFSALQILCNEQNTATCPWTFEPFLLADGSDPRGTALRKIRENDVPHNEAPQPIGGKSSKIPLLIAQMNDAYRQYPGEALEFHFIDDRQDLIDDILNRLDPAKIPPGMTLKVSKFDFISIAFELPGALGLVGQITSTVPLEVTATSPIPIAVTATSEVPLAVAANSEVPIAQNTLPNEEITTNVQRTAVDPQKLKNEIWSYLNYLTDKLKVKNIKITQGVSITAPDNTSKNISKLISRYNIIYDLNEQIKDKSSLDEEDLNNAKIAVHSCSHYKTNWIERSFITKLFDILSLGVRPLIRTFFSNETKHQGNIEQLTKSPSLG